MSSRLPDLSCPLPIEGDRITLSHGAGAGASARLFEKLLFPHFDNALLAERHDGARIELGDTILAFTTDTFVVKPLEFPGGDIGSLAVCGTLNDLAMCGAQPRALSCALVLEEGLPLADLERIVSSLARTAHAAGVPIATGDTKVVERGKGDGVFINTTGVGIIPAPRRISPQRIAEGDVVLVSGPIGEHGAAVLSVREGIAFDSEICSDSAVLCDLVENLFAAVGDIHCLRDPTRGGVGSALCELAEVAQKQITISEEAIPISPAVRAACELLGLDPLFLACEGRCLVFAPQASAAPLLAALRNHPLGRGAQIIGRVEAGRGRVVVQTGIGSRRLLLRPAGEALPRIC